MISVLATVFFFCALVQTLFAARILKISDQLRSKHPAWARFFHFAGEPEIIFSLWAASFMVVLMISWGFDESFHWLDQRNFSEAAFVVVIMVLASTKPITVLSEKIILGLSRFLPFSEPVAVYVTILVAGPLLGSLITEPAAMTISALLLKGRILDPLKAQVPKRFFYVLLGTLFVNISVGGTLTHFAAPPVLMVARVWNWDTPFMFMNFGWKAMIAILLNTALAAWMSRHTLALIGKEKTEPDETKRSIPAWITLAHLGFIALCIVGVHHPAFVIGLFLIFLGFYDITRDHQSRVKIEESILVGFFLGGLVILTAKQGWWLSPILRSIENLTLYMGTLFLSPITDNAAMTSLASQVEGLSEGSKYLIVAGAVVGGGLTIIANAPNPAGFALLRGSLPSKRLSPKHLFLGGLPPTLIAAVIFYLL